MDIMVASKNNGKIKEIRKILDKNNINLKTYHDIDIPEVDETGVSFVENAILKARSASIVTGLPSIADDSGIEVDYLDSRPGVKSARYSGDNATNMSNNDKLLKELNGVSIEKRNACYRCVIVFMRFPDDPFPVISTGSWYGLIAEKPEGENGFGYDPIFLPKTGSQTFGEIEPELKHAISHRAEAFQKLTNSLFG